MHLERARTSKNDRNDEFRYWNRCQRPKMMKFNFLMTSQPQELLGFSHVLRPDSQKLFRSALDSITISALLQLNYWPILSIFFSTEFTLAGHFI